MLAGAILLASASYALSQQNLFPQWPVVGAPAYSCGQVNGVSNCTVPAGPTVVTGSEAVPAATANTSSGPANVYLSLRSLNALPIQFVNAASVSTSISASDISGGVFYYSTGGIASANVTLPNAPIDGQQFYIGANQTITTLNVSTNSLTSGDTIAANTAPTVLTASTTVPQGYLFIYHATNNSWYRLQ